METFRRHEPFRLGIGQRRKRAVAVEGSDRAFKEQTNRESCTLIETISAAGNYTNPTIIWKVKKKLIEWDGIEVDQIQKLQISFLGFLRKDTTTSK